MSKQHDQIAALLFRKVDAIDIRTAQNTTLLTQAVMLLTEILGRVSASSEAPSKKPTLLDKLLPWAPRVFGPIVQSHVLPWVIAFMTGVPAGFIAFWKAFTRGWFGF